MIAGALSSLGLSIGAFICLGCTARSDISWTTEFRRVPSVVTTIAGKVYLVTRSGRKVPARRDIVYLDRVTDRTRVWFDDLIVQRAGSGIARRQDGVPSAGQEADASTRLARTDDHGSFVFEDTVPGEYYLTCELIWYVPAPWPRLAWDLDFRPVGGIAYGVVTIHAGERVDMELTRPELYPEPYFKADAVMPESFLPKSSSPPPVERRE